MYQIVFSDVDGTLLNDQHQMTPLTQQSIIWLHNKQIPFVIVSARSPSGIFPIMEENHFKSHLIAYSGALIMDEYRHILYEKGMKTALAMLIIQKLNAMNITWCVYSFDQWYVQNRQDEKIQREENIVKAQSQEASLDDLLSLPVVHKILCICRPNQTLIVEKQLKKDFPQLTIVKSSDILIEIMEQGINKAQAVKQLCQLWNIPIQKAVAFGDQYNDLDMLLEVGYGWAMGNAPKEIKKQVKYVTLDNNHDGIHYALNNMNYEGKKI